MCLSGCLAACVCSPAQMIKWAGPSKVTIFVTQLQSVPLSEAVNLCFHKPGSLYPCLCKAHHQGNVIKHLLKVSHFPMDPPLLCRQRKRSCSTVNFSPNFNRWWCVSVSVCINLCLCARFWPRRSMPAGYSVTCRLRHRYREESSCSLSRPCDWRQTCSF